MLFQHGLDGSDSENLQKRLEDKRFHSSEKVDSYVVDEQDGSVRVRDDKGVFIMYEAALDDLQHLEEELVQV